MSLINEALKRAKQAHQENSPPQAPVPTLRPVEPPQQGAGHSFGLVLPIGLGLLAVLGLVIVFLLWKKGTTPESASAAPTPVAAKTLSPDANDVSKTPASATPTPGTVAPVASAVSHLETTAPRAERPAAITASSTPIGTNQAAVSTANSDSNRVAAPPALAPLRLQSIVFNPKKPSAMINGRVLFVGDRIRDLRIAAIHSSDVVLTGSDRTNVLSLEP